jgi:putative heme iron utilization protein
LFDGTAGLDDPLTGPRASVLGRAERCDDEALLGRFVARHPAAAGYAEFADFRLYRVRIERAHLVAGFGAIDWIDGSDIVYDVTDATDLAEAENGIIVHMNDDHGDALEDYAHNLLNLSGGPWRMIGIDPEGIDLRCRGEVGRFAFEAPVHGPGEARERLVALAHQARVPTAGDAK